MPLQSRVTREFGEAVQRAMAGLSQSEVALRSQISVGYINRIARGSVPSRAIILRLADALAADPAPLLAAAGYETTPGERKRSVDAEDAELLGAQAAAQHYRELWDRYILPAFPDAEMPSGAGLPLSRAGLRSRIARLFEELLEDSEEANPF